MRIDAGKNNQSSSPYFHGEPVLNAMSQSIPAALVLLLGQLCINLLEQKKKDKNKSECGIVDISNGLRKRWRWWCVNVFLCGVMGLFVCVDNS